MIGDGDRLVAELLGRGIFRCHRRRQGLRRRRVGDADTFGNAEIEQLGRAACGNQDVGWFDIAVHDQALVRVRERSGHINQ